MVCGSGRVLSQWLKNDQESRMCKHYLATNRYFCDGGFNWWLITFVVPFGEDVKVPLVAFQHLIGTRYTFVHRTIMSFGTSPSQTDLKYA